MSFKYELGKRVSIICSKETGYVIGRAEYTDVANQYQVRYKSADGRAVETWWAEDALQSE